MCTLTQFTLLLLLLVQIEDGDNMLPYEGELGFHISCFIVLFRTFSALSPVNLPTFSNSYVQIGGSYISRTLFCLEFENLLTGNACHVHFHAIASSIVAFF